MSDGLAHRTYEYESRGLNTVLVNDATIPSDEYEEAGLAEEITASARGHKHLVACVNRGILVEEERSLLSLNASKLEPGQALVNWLRTQGDSSVAGSWTVVTHSSSDYLITGQLRYGNEVVAEIAGVYVDVCSLLERKPKVVRGTAGLFTPEPYKIADFVERLSWDDHVTSAGHLLMEVLDSLHAVDGLSNSSALNPIVANIQSLQSRAVRAGFLATLRAAEIVNGQRFTYREIWGAIVRAIVGPLPESISTEELPRYFDDGMMYSDSPIEDFEAIIKLANLRFSQSIYGTTSAVSKSPSDPRRNPVTRLTHVIDPMKDAIPGFTTHDPSTGWASVVTEAFSGPSAEGSPLRSLTDELGKSDHDPFNDALTDFDYEVDEAYMRVMNFDRTKDAERAKYIHWYGAYLGRHYAISHGIPAFRKEIKLWTEAWYSSPQLPRSLSGGLRALLRPKRNPRDSDSKSLIPILDSRTDPIVGTVKEPKIALQTGNFEMKTCTEAESLFLLLFEQTTEISRMPLDLALTREAGACALEYPGMTELTETTSPRLERFRSARLIPDNLDRDQYRIVHGDGDTILTVAMPHESSEAN
jgi:hypothetical protein